MRTVRSLPSACFAVAVAVAAAATACSTGSDSARVAAEFPLLPGDSRVLHAVQSVELRNAMYDFERISTDKLPDRLDRDKMRQTDLDEIATLADTLGRSAAEIPDALTANDVPPDEEHRFRELAEQLVRDSFALRDRAILGEVGPARDETEQLLATCNACHALSRVPPLTHATATAAVEQSTPQSDETTQAGSDEPPSRDARRRARGGSAR